MTARLSKGCTVVLLLSMALALAAGLMAWGPVTLTAADHRYADPSTLFGGGFVIRQALTVLACLPLCAVGLWGMQNTLHADWPEEVARPWLRFFACAFLMSASAAVYHVAPDALGWVLTNTFAAAAFLMLLLGCLAERVDVRFGSASATGAGLAAAAGAGLWWLAGDTWAMGGDIRPLLLLQALPALLIPAGALGLPGRHTSSGDWLWMLGLYATARLLEHADAAVLAATGAFSGHTAMHLLLAAGSALLAYRASVAPGDSTAEATGPAADEAALSAASQRQTSLNTAG